MSRSKTEVIRFGKSPVLHLVDNRDYATYCGRDTNGGKYDERRPAINWASDPHLCKQCKRVAFS